MTVPGRGTVGRLSYVDWMRGLAILIMIEAHVLDAGAALGDCLRTRSTDASGVQESVAGAK